MLWGRSDGPHSIPPVTTGGEFFQRAEEAFERSDWPAAIAAFRAGLRLEPDAQARHYYRLGLALERSGDWESAVDAISQAIARRRKTPAWWYFKLARGYRVLRRWSEAAEAFELAISKHEDPAPGWYYQLGNCYERLLLWDEARDRYQRGVDKDPDIWPLERRMLELETNEFPTRRIMLRFIAEHLDEIRSAAAESLGRDDRSDVIYSYWAQGFGTAPEIVRRCHERLKERSSAPVLDLDEPGMQKMISLPADIEARGIHPTHRSDLLRLELLARHGGSWLDATCLVMSDPAPELAALREPSGYFAFGKRNTTIASWLMTSVPDHYLVRMLRAGLHTYWRHHDRLTEYYVLHHIFEALTRLDEEFARLWAATPRRYFDGPFRLRWNFGEPYVEQDFRQMLSGSFVHKLTYKFQPHEVASGTMLGQLLEVM